MGGQLGVRWYVFSDEPVKGFFAGLSAGVDLPVNGDPFFVFPRWMGALSLGYSLRVGERLQLTPGLDITPFGGLGFPEVGRVALRCGVSWVY